jgi:mannose-6-phosphate isomerase-like protein (cupin superfamily)
MQVHKLNELSQVDNSKTSDVYTLLDNYHMPNLTLSQTILNPNKNTRGHKHDGLDEVYIFTDIPHNQAYIDVGPEDGKLQRTNITPNMLVTLKGGEFHRVCNLGDQAIKFTCIFQSYDRTSTLK